MEENPFMNQYGYILVDIQISQHVWQVFKMTSRASEDFGRVHWMFFIEMCGRDRV